MSARPYLLVSGIFFAAIALLHILRLVGGLSFVVGDVVVPMWISVFGILVTGALSIWAFRLRTASSDT